MNKPYIAGIAWFTEREGDARQIIGVVLAWTEDNEHRAYIGVAKGSSTQEDARNIMKHGAPFPLSEARKIIKDFGEETNIEL